MTRIVLVSMAVLLSAARCARPGLPRAAVMLATERLPRAADKPLAREPMSLTSEYSGPAAPAVAASPSATPSPPHSPTATLSPAASPTTTPSSRPSPTATATPQPAPTRPTLTRPATAQAPAAADKIAGAADGQSAPKPAPDRRYAFVARYRAQSEVLLDGVPELAQRRALSCEAASMRMVLAARGVAASEDEILARMGASDNPHQGFRGNVDGDGHSPGLPNYGAYAEVVARVLQSYGVPATVVRGMSDETLREVVRGGQAVIVWLTAQDAPVIIEESGYRLVEAEHVYVVVGVLVDGRLLVHDSWGARSNSGRSGTFPVWAITQWDLFDRMAVIVPLS